MPDQTPEQRESALKLARFMNPWTIQIRLRSGSWQEFCHDAPITLQDAEEREEQLKRDNPAATFRVIPWLNMTQWQHVRTQEIDHLHAENVRLREALKAANGVLSHVGCCEESDMWKQHATSARTLIGRALSGSPATED